MKIHRILAIVPVLALVGCAWLKANGPAIATDITAVGFCELNYIENTSAPTPAGAVLACAGLALTDAEHTFATLSATVDTSGAPTPVAAKAKAGLHR
jgi:hypothetical protein